MLFLTSSFGGSFGDLGVIFDAHGSILEVLGADFEALEAPKPPRPLFGIHFEVSWGLIGAVLGGLGVVLGLSLIHI